MSPDSGTSEEISRASPHGGTQMTLGEWYVLGEKAGALAMHAALLPTGQVLYFGGSERRREQHDAGPGGWNHACIWTPDDGHVDAIPSPGCDLFCCGHCFLGSV